MAKWKRVNEELPECDCGDRVIGIVHCRERKDADLLARVVIFVAEESGWRDIEDRGFDIGECEGWILERDLIANSRVAN